jgi:integrase
MPRRTKKDPSYRLHKQSGQAVVTLPGGLGGRRDVLLGKHGSPESEQEYHRVLGEWKANGRRLPQPAADEKSGLTISELIFAYWQRVERHYVKDGKQTNEPGVIKLALRFLKNLYGHMPAREFGPLALKAVREAMVEHKVVKKFKARNLKTGELELREKVMPYGMTRRCINKQIGRIKRMFAWAVEEELVPVEVHSALLRVKGLKKGKTKAREKPRVNPVPAPHIDAVLPLIPAAVATMIQVQQLTGARPQEVMLMRAIDIDMTGPVWEYHPGRYKTEHHNDEDDPDRERIVFIGPRAQELLKPYLSLNVTDYLFSPKRAEEERTTERRAQRKTPLWPSHLEHQKKQRKARGRRSLRDHYDGASYRRAIRRGCLKAGVPVWQPNQLRHSRLTEVRKHFGLEAGKACGGHREIGVTQHYAEQDYDLARKVMAEIG